MGFLCVRIAVRVYSERHPFGAIGAARWRDESDRLAGRITGGGVRDAVWLDSVKYRSPSAYPLPLPGGGDERC